MTFLFLVCGAAGDYGDRSEWRVDLWSTNAAAAARVKELHALIGALNAWVAAHDEKEPPTHDESTEAEWKKWERWSKARVRKIKQFARHANDKYFERHAHYWIEKLQWLDR